MKNWLFDSTNFMYVLLAMAGGVSRYLHSYTHGAKFHLGTFVANGALSGFSGYMFALAGESLQMPPALLYMCAGIGGFMGHSALEWGSEFLKNKFKL